jgi:hypothetical protein
MNHSGLPPRGRVRTAPIGLFGRLSRVAKIITPITGLWRGGNPWMQACLHGAREQRAPGAPSSRQSGVDLLRRRRR